MSKMSRKVTFWMDGKDQEKDYYAQNEKLSNANTKMTKLSKAQQFIPVM